MKLYKQLNEMAALLGPDADPEDEKKILNRIKIMKTLSGKVDFEKAINSILERVNKIRKSNGLEEIDRTELLSRTMKQDVLRDIKTKKEKEKKQREEEEKKFKEKEQEILLKFVPIKLENTASEIRKIYGDNKGIFKIATFNGRHYGVPFTIKVYTTTKNLDDKEIKWNIDTNGHGKVVEINKGNLIGEIRFPGGEKYKYGTKIVLTYKKFIDSNNEKIYAKVVRL